MFFVSSDENDRSKIRAEGPFLSSPQSLTVSNFFGVDGTRATLVAGNANPPGGGRALSYLKGITLFGLLLALTVVPAVAQDYRGNIYVNVTTDDGEAIVGASVMAVGAGATRTAGPVGRCTPGGQRGGAR